MSNFEPVLESVGCYVRRRLWSYVGLVREAWDGICRDWRHRVDHKVRIHNFNAHRGGEEEEATLEVHGRVNGVTSCSDVVRCLVLGSSDVEL